LIMLDRSAALTAVFPLDGRSFDQALQWLGDRLVQRGLDPAPLSRPLHFALDDDPLLDGATFRLRGREKAFEELGRWYSNAALCLASVASPVRCWPHHFDIAVQILAGEHSIGVGMSPGDVSYGQPYFYVTPWPYPAAADLPPLRLGKWHTNGWTGAVLTGDEILASADQQQLVEEFLAGAIGVLR
jgi:hypothetical protein